MENAASCNREVEGICSNQLSRRDGVMEQKDLGSKIIETLGFVMGSSMDQRHDGDLDTLAALAESEGSELIAAVFNI